MARTEDPGKTSVDSRSTATSGASCWLPHRRRSLTPRSRRIARPACRPSMFRGCKANFSSCWCRSRRRGACWRSERWAATAPSGWRARCPETGTLFRWNSSAPCGGGARESRNAGLLGRVDLRVGRRSTPSGVGESRAPRTFDLIFIDADKGNYPEYLRMGVEAIAPGNGDRGRQCGSRWKGHRTRKARIRTSKARAA